MSRSFGPLTPGLLVLAVAGAATLLPANAANAQRRIQGQRYGGGPLYQNPAGRALGSGSFNMPNGTLGQNAMGAGDALDSNLQVGSGGRNFRQPTGYSYAAAQANNLVVTNGVAGGRGFRGAVDYYAPGDFAAPTGDRVAYGFRRDSALSGLDFVSSVQQQDAFNIAQGVGVFQYRRDFTSLPEVNTVGAAERIDDAQIRLDRATNNLTSRNLLTTAVAPSDIGIVQIADNEFARMTSSPVRGIQYESAGVVSPLSTFDLALATEARIQGMDLTDAGVVPERFDANSQFEKAVDSEPVDERITSPSSGESQYKEILRRVFEEYENRDDVALTAVGLSRMRRDFERLGAPRSDAETDDRQRAETSFRQEGLPGQRHDGPPGERREGLPGDRREGLPGDRSEGLPGERSPDAGLGLGPADGEGGSGDSVFPPIVDTAPDGEGPRGSDRGAGDDESNVRTVDELIDALAHRTQVTELADPRMRTRVGELVGQAEQAMRDKDYFRAEDRFDRALQLNPGNPVLEGARANAQIGAGLYRSASVTLSGLFRKHEEMIDVGYDSDLLPSRTRLRLAAQSIEGIIEKDPDGSSEMGLVVAYIGRQLGDRAMITRGLESIDSPRLTSVIQPLRRIWLSDKPIPGLGDDDSE